MVARASLVALLAVMAAGCLPVCYAGGAAAALSERVTSAHATTQPDKNVVNDQPQ
jgi:hypothetical protein